MCRDKLLSVGVSTVSHAIELSNSWSNIVIIIHGLFRLFCEFTDSGHFTIRDVVYDEYSDEENSAETPAKQNRNLSARHNTGRASSTVGSQVMLVTCSEV